MNTESDSRKQFQETIKHKLSERRRAREEEKREGIWFGLAMMGIVGWSVAIPTLIGVAIGIGLDAAFPQLSPGILIASILVGLACGCWIAWFWIQQESTTEEESEELRSKDDQ
ncbi:MAG: Na+-translocating F1F0-ATP synthase subunit AtpZ [Halothece sp. Uz-M2-17]|nr:Na+-translocating F1F0-ATP synthase subunit AtpZ [Halothece sp. Uz-M2-17]